MKNSYFQDLLKKLSLLLLVFLSSQSIIMASHIIGGEITYQWVSGNAYNVRVTLYRDCSGIPYSPAVTVDFSSVSTVFNSSTGLNMVGSPEEVSPICAASLPNSTCNTGLLYGVQRAIYEGTITFPSAAADWVLSYTDCCRNSAPINVVNPGSMQSYFEAKLNNLAVPFNNSVQFTSIPVNMINNNVTTSLGWSAYDPDQDSLVFELVPAREGASLNLTYAPGYTALQPFAASLPTQLDPVTGILTVSPNLVQFAIVCMRVSEYRSGVLISEIYRDLQIGVDNSTNNLPALTGMNGTSSFLTSACPGDSIEFTVDSSDPDIGQSLTIIMDQSPAPAAAFLTFGTPPTGLFTWTPTLADVSSQPYVFTLKVTDDHCDFYGTQSYAYTVYVNGCNTNDVWPGDANADGDANLYDLLAIGIAFNDNGPVRPSASINWVAQPCPDWLNSFWSGVNHKHADCDGNGTVNFADTVPLFQNYGLTHPLRLMPQVQSVNPQLIVTASNDTVGTSATVDFDITLGTASAPIDSIYGLAFRMYYDASLIDTSMVSVSYPGSMFGTNGIDMVTVNKNYAGPGYVDIALSRINQQNISGTGNVARVTIVTTDNVSGKVSLYLTPYDIVAVTTDGNPIIIDPIGTSIVIDPVLIGIPDSDESTAFSLYPVPADNELMITLTGSTLPEKIMLMDVTGRTVIAFTPTELQFSLDVANVTPGAYFLKVVSGTSERTQKIVLY